MASPLASHAHPAGRSGRESTVAGLMGAPPPVVDGGLGAASRLARRGERACLEFLRNYCY